MEVYSIAYFEKLTHKELSDLIKANLLKDHDLTFAAEMLGASKDSSLVIETLKPLLTHHGAVVREGVIYGLQNHLTPEIERILKRMSKEDPSPAVREAAKL